MVVLVKIYCTVFFLSISFLFLITKFKLNESRFSLIFEFSTENFKHWTGRLLDAGIILHKKWNFPLRISSVNVTKFAGRSPWWKRFIFSLVVTVGLARIFYSTHNHLKTEILQNWTIIVSKKQQNLVKF